MAEAECDVLFLADQLNGRDEVQTLAGLIQRLEDLGHGIRLICQSASSEHGSLDLAEYPGLGRRWQRPWTIRNLDLAEDPGRPRIMHVLSSSMADAALEIAERWGIPYLLCVDEFPHRADRLRLSHYWCRGLIGSNLELCQALARDFSIPSWFIHEIPKGLVGSQGAKRLAGPGRVPVVGAAGPMNLGSGFATFLSAARKVVDAGVDAEFVIAGQGEDEGDLRRRAERLRIAERLTFADEIPVGLSFWEVLDVYCQSSVIPTVGRQLTLAMASGVPCIATDVEGLRCLMKDGVSGLVVPHGEVGALAQSIVGLLKDPESAAILGKEGRRAILRDHHPDHEAERLHVVYRDVVAAGLGPRDSRVAMRSAFEDSARDLESGRNGGVKGSAIFPWLGSEG